MDTTEKIKAGHVLYQSLMERIELSDDLTDTNASELKSATPSFERIEQRLNVVRSLVVSVERDTKRFKKLVNEVVGETEDMEDMSGEWWKGNSK